MFIGKIATKIENYSNTIEFDRLMSKYYFYFIKSKEFWID